MAAYELRLDGTRAPDDLLDSLLELEVEENLDDPDALRLRLPVTRSASGQLRFVEDGTLQPYTQVALVLTSGSARQCIFDGYVLSWRLSLNRSLTSSSIVVYAQDSSWLMNLSLSVREWPNMTDVQVANSIFNDYGFRAAKQNASDPPPAHTTNEHSLFQRATDLEFLRVLAARTGRACRIICSEEPGDRVGFFARPDVSADPILTIALDRPESWTVESLEFEWDVLRPTGVTTGQVSFLSEGDDITERAYDSSGLAPMDGRALATFARFSRTTGFIGPADPAELPQRAAAVVADAEWFARCNGDADLARVDTVIRAGCVVILSGVGLLHSGRWLVSQARHRFAPESSRVSFELIRNAIGESETAESTSSARPAGNLPRLSLGPPS